MSKYKIYLYSEGVKDPKIIEVTPDEKVAEFLKKHCAGEGETFLSLEDDDNVITAETFEKAGIKEKHRIHCHRCRKVTVKVTYNGTDMSKTFPPSTTGKKVFKWVIKEFNISEEDSGNLELRINNANGDKLKNTDHIGSFVKHPHCELLLFLVPKENIQG